MVQKTFVANHNGITSYSNTDFRETRFFEVGQDAAQAGKPKESCPYKGNKQRDWIAGWETVCLDGEFGVLQ